MINQHSFSDLITKYIVEIPIIQRDYAQGRKSDNVEYIRNRFAKSLVEHLVNETPMHLGFIYGKLEGKDRLKALKLHEDAVNSLLFSVTQYATQFQIAVEAKVTSDEIETSNSLRLIPLDGQQRLTTLFLLHWYLTMRKSSLAQAEANTNWLSNFKYNNRKSTLAFFAQLTNLSHMAVVRDELGADIQDQLIRYSWYLEKWNFDASVSGSLVMLQAIHAEFANFPNFNFDTVQLESLQFNFDFMDLDELRQSDELYIKMNERGKQLTDFEHFKAWLQDYSEKKYTEPEHQTFLKQFWKKLDTEWLDFFWKNMDVDYTALDDFFFNYIKNIAVSYHCATNASRAIPGYLKTLLQQVRNSDYNKNSITYIPISSFVQVVKNENDEQVLFELFSIESLYFINDCFESHNFLQHNQPFSESLDTILKTPFVSKPIAQAYLKQNSFTPNLWDQTCYYFIQRLIQKRTDIDFENHCDDWLRIMRNLIYNTYIQSPENYYDALHSINELFDNGTTDLKTTILNEDFTLRFFSQSQLKEEKRKAQLSETEWNIGQIRKLENHHYFYGRIGFILELAEGDSGLFEIYGTMLADLFEKETEDFLLQRALLSKGDYLVQTGSNHTFCRTETDGLRSRNENWRRVFSDSSKNQILKQLLDHLILEHNPNLEDGLRAVMRSHNYTPSNWEYFFIENGRAIKECPYNQIRYNNQNDIRLLHSSTITGYHLELRSIYLFQEIEKKGLDFSPFKKLIYLWDKSTSGRPGIQFHDFEWNGKPYRLDVRYSFQNKNFDLCLYHDAETTNSRQSHAILDQQLKTYSFDPRFNHYFQAVDLDNIFDTLSSLFEILKVLPS